MVTKDWMRFFASLKSAEIQEMVALLSGMKGVDKRDAGEEALMQDQINALPDPPEFDGWKLLQDGHDSVLTYVEKMGHCWSCNRPAEIPRVPRCRTCGQRKEEAQS